MTTEDNKILMRRFVEEVWNDHKLTAADDFFARDAQFFGENGRPKGPEGIKEKTGTLFTAFPDFKANIELMVAYDNKVTAYLRETGTHQGKFMGVNPTGKKASWTEILTFEFAGGKVSTSWTQSQMYSALRQLMPTNEEILRLYYQYANAGDWSAWCDLFAEDMVMDEQLAGHIETLATLRPMMDGMGVMYKKFQNIPLHIFTSGDEGAVVSHISATSASGKDIEAEVMNYFRFSNGKISYMANFHDTRPFAPLSEKASSNADLVNRMYECFAKGDMQTIKNDIFHPDIVWRMPGHHPLSGVIKGVDSVIAFFGALFKAGIKVDNTHFGILDDGTVVEKHMGHGVIDGKEFLFPTCTTYGIRDGKIADVQVHTGDQHTVDRYMWAKFKLKAIPDRLAI
jgi:ketosteroid isomerase-like protein/predicted ester cyclase